MTKALFARTSSKTPFVGFSGNIRRVFLTEWLTKKIEQELPGAIKIVEQVCIQTENKFQGTVHTAD
jgi:hypothetical protein